MASSLHSSSGRSTARTIHSQAAEMVVSSNRIGHTMTYPASISYTKTITASVTAVMSELSAKELQILQQLEYG